MFSHIPEIVHGFDVGTMSVQPNGYPIAMSAVTFDIISLKMLGCSSVFCRSDDEEAKKVFHYDDTWWKSNSENSPSKQVYDLTFTNATAVYVPDALQTMADYFGKYWRNHRQVVSSKTPSFDVTIMQNALRTCGMRGIDMLQRPSLIDNSHTALRALKFMGMEPNIEIEKAIWTNDKDHLEHFTPHEAGIAGYCTARYYHLLYINSISPHLAKKAHELMTQGKYNQVDFFVEHPELKVTSNG